MIFLLFGKRKKKCKHLNGFYIVGPNVEGRDELLLVDFVES